MARAFIQIEDTQYKLMLDKNGVKTMVRQSSDVIGLTQQAESLNWDCEENEHYYVTFYQ